jgi:hypothetical protein
MKRKPLVLAVPAAILILNYGAAAAGQITNEEADIVCAVDKWDETEPENGHKLVDAAMIRPSVDYALDDFACLLVGHRGNSIKSLPRNGLDQNSKRALAVASAHPH